MASRRRIRQRFALASQAAHNHRLRLRPALEALEPRVVLSTFTVDLTTDTAPTTGGSGSGLAGDLRYCITHANADNQANTIVFDSTVFATQQTITLGGSELELKDTGGTQTITGPGASRLTVGGNKTSRVFEVTSGVTANLSGLTITGGNANYGGGLYNQGGTVTLTNVTVSGNTATISGGGLFNSPAEFGTTLTLDNCTVGGNTARYNGGGIFNRYSIESVTLSNTTVSGNTAGWGGGLFNKYGTMTLSNTTVSGNNATNRGGGLYNYGRYYDGIVNSATATLSNCTVSGNSAAVGGGLENDYSTLALTDCTVSGNSAGRGGVSFGGGLFNQSGTSTLTDTTVSGNFCAGEGGGVQNLHGLLKGATLLMSDVTISGNSAQYGGGLDNYGSAALTNCTVSGNSANVRGGGVFNIDKGVGIFGYGTITLTNTIVAGQTAGGDVFGTPESSSEHNLIGDPASAGGLTQGTNGNIVGDGHGHSIDITTVFATTTGPSGPVPVLADNGGPTQTIALRTGSPAIGQGVAFAGITTDQRGFALDAPQPDMGAFQSDPLVINTTSDGSSSPPGILSLRQAVNLANVLGAATTITFDSTVFSTPQAIALTNGPLELSDPVGLEAIAGPAAGVTITAGGLNGVFLVDGGVTASLSGLTLSGGSTSDDGGGVLNAGALTMTNCTLSGDSAGNGGGVANSGTLTLTDCTLSGDSAGNGGCVWNSSGTVTMTDCTLSGDSAGNGGGVWNSSGTVTLTDCTLSLDSAGNGGGGVGNSGTVTLTDCTLSLDSAGNGGGVWNSSGTLTLTDCTLSGDSAGNGGGVANSGTDADRLHPLARLGRSPRRRGRQLRHADDDRLHRRGRLGR